MKRIEKDEKREHRIYFDVVVDAYDEVERAMGWYCYLDDRISFPFKAKCITKREISPLIKVDEVEVTDIASGDECSHEIFVVIKWQKRKFAVPLMQLEGIDLDEETEEAIADWHYWVARGYLFLNQKFCE